MKILKRIVMALAIIIGLALLIAAVLPNQYTVNQSIVINKPKAQVYNYVMLLKNQQAYSEWVKPDPAAVTYAGTDGTVGAQQFWDSKISGKGIQTITKLEPNLMEVSLEFIKPFSGKATANHTFTENTNNTTTLTTNFASQSPYPLNLINFISKKMINDTELKNLQNIKEILEKQ
jgi:hypothetical protein